MSEGEPVKDVSAKPSARNPEELSWGVARRFAFLEFRLFWGGRFNRRDLIEHFRISVPQASIDLTRYQELAPGNIEYDKYEKCYVATPEFAPRFMEPDARQYLAQLGSISEGILAPEEAWIAAVPSFGSFPIPSRTVDPKKLQVVVAAIRDRKALHVRYQSMSKAEPSWRWITPHALGYDGFRWHARSFCHNDETFKDFVFARILKVGETKAHDVDPSQDRAWVETVKVVIAPHPGLSDEQKKTIGLDYGMRNGKRTIEVRRAFLFYLVKRLGLEGDARGRRPQDQQIVLANQKEVEKALGPAP